MGPLEASKPWSNQGVEGAKQFLDRVWRAFVNDNKIKDEENKNLEVPYNKMVKKVTNDFENLSFNTAIAEMMIFINAVYKENVLPKKYAEGFIKLLNPIAPHITEEMWEILGHDKSIAHENWPVYDEEKTQEDQITIGVQVNGKLRGTISVNLDENESKIKEKALSNENVLKHTNGKEIVKIIIIKNKIVNIVVK